MKFLLEYEGTCIEPESLKISEFLYSYRNNNYSKFVIFNFSFILRHFGHGLLSFPNNNFFNITFLETTEIHKNK